MRLNLVFLLIILLNSILYVEAGPWTGLFACATCCGIANCPALLIPGTGWAIAAGSAGACFWQACTPAGVPLDPRAIACKAIFLGVGVLPTG